MTLTGNEELKHLRHNFLLEVSFNAIWSASPILCVLGESLISLSLRIYADATISVSFYVYTKVMGQELTPSTAFASLAVWNELRFALNCVPDTLVQAIQCIVSLRRIEAYLNSDEVSDEEDNRMGVPPPSEDGEEVAFKNATVTWPSTKDVKIVYEVGAATPKNAFELQDIDVKFPTHKMSLVCGSLGSGKTLLLLGTSPYIVSESSIDERGCSSTGRSRRPRRSSHLPPLFTRRHQSPQHRMGQVAERGELDSSESNGVRSSVGVVAECDDQEQHSLWIAVSPRLSLL